MNSQTDQLIRNLTKNKFHLIVMTNRAIIQSVNSKFTTSNATSNTQQIFYLLCSQIQSVYCNFSTYIHDCFIVLKFFLFSKKKSAPRSGQFKAVLQAGHVGSIANQESTGAHEKRRRETPTLTTAKHQSG
jgi:hypothetical protein